mmetsp:Transcript_11880/g.32947  ORF Transcript_11880/g.32947 Transcript_11880/m.32947 type:complete len:372 (+) Transcript_11880:668-1783(+)
MPRSLGQNFAILFARPQNGFAQIVRPHNGGPKVFVRPGPRPVRQGFEHGKVIRRGSVFGFGLSRHHESVRPTAGCDRCGGCCRVGRCGRNERRGSILRSFRIALGPAGTGINDEFRLFMLFFGNDFPRVDAFGSIFQCRHGHSQTHNGAVSHFLTPLFGLVGRILTRQDARVVHNFARVSVKVRQVLPRFHEPIVGNGGAGDNQKGHQNTHERMPRAGRNGQIDNIVSTQCPNCHRHEHGGNAPWQDGWPNGTVNLKNDRHVIFAVVIHISFVRASAGSWGIVVVAAVIVIVAETLSVAFGLEGIATAGLMKHGCLSHPALPLTFFFSFATFSIVLGSGVSAVVDVVVVVRRTGARNHNVQQPRLFARHGI